MTTIVIAHLVRVALVYATISFVEHMAHRYIMHRPKLAKLLGSKHLMDAYTEHWDHHFGCYEEFNRETGKCGFLNLGVNSSTELFIVAGPALIALYFDWITAVILVVAALLHGVLWSAVHTEMHRKENTWFSRTRIFKVLARHHFLHHRHTRTNFNALFLGWDRILGTRARATDADRAEMVNEYWRVRRSTRTKQV